MRSRIIFLFFIFLFMAVGLIGRAVRLQLFPDARLLALKERQFKRELVLKPQRGVIYDRNYRELAASVPSYSLYTDPSLISGPKKISHKLAKYLHMSESEIYKKLRQKKRRFFWIQRQLSQHQMENIKAWKIKGLAFIKEPKRVYPNHNLLSQLIGFVGTEGSGLEGLEMSLQKFLGGEEKHFDFRKDARGRPLIVNGQVFMELPQGSDVVLTVDSHLQFYLEKELQKAVQLHDADSAMGIVLDVKTSDVLAMANVPTYDLNAPFQGNASTRRLRTITDSFEPGSTMKTVVIASAIDKGVIKPNTKIFCEDGSFKVDDRIIREADSHHHFGWLTVSEILAESSNIGASKIALQLGDQVVYESLLKFGFGKESGVDLPGEVRGILHQPPWRNHLLSNISFGQGVTATALQVANAYATIANGGVWRTPQIIKSIESEVSKKNLYHGEKIEHRVVSEKTAQLLRLMLMGATDKSSTGFNARVPGYPVAGKTGTAQKVDPNGRGYLQGGYISSFAGFIPALEPKYVIYIVVDNPKNNYYGSQVAAPLFAKVASYMVESSGLNPLLITQKDILEPIHKKKEAMQDVKQDLMPAPTNFEHMPNLHGLSLREVYKTFSEAGLEIKIHGRGRVVKTKPEPGEALSKKTKISVELESL